MRQSGKVVVASIDRMSNSGNHIATFNGTEYNIEEISISDTTNKVLLRINGDEATKLYAEGESINAGIERIDDDQAYVNISNEWNLVISNEVDYYDLDDIYVDFDDMFDEGSNIRIQIKKIDTGARRVHASPLLVTGGLYEHTSTVSKKDEEGYGIIGTKYDDAQIKIREFGGFGSSKIVFRITNINDSQATGVRYFYAGEEFLIEPDGSLSGDQCYYDLSDERRMVIRNASSVGDRMKVEVMSADDKKVIAQRKSKQPTTSINAGEQSSPEKESQPENSGDNRPEDIIQTESNSDATTQQGSERNGSQGKRKKISVRISVRQKAELEREARERGISKSEYIREILNERSRVNKLEEAVERKQNRIDELEAQLTERSQIEQKIESLSGKNRNEESYQDRRQKILDEGSLIQRLAWKVTGVPVDRSDKE